MLSATRLHTYVHTLWELNPSVTAEEEFLEAQTGEKRGLRETLLPEKDFKDNSQSSVSWDQSNLT